MWLKFSTTQEPYTAIKDTQVLIVAAIFQHPRRGMAYPLAFPGTATSFRPNVATLAATVRRAPKTVAALCQGNEEGVHPTVRSENEEDKGTY